MTSVDCIDPVVFTSERWGDPANAKYLDRIGRYSTWMIGPESEAESVELRPLNEDDYSVRHVISVDRPLIAPISPKGLGIFPTRDVSGIHSTSEAGEFFVHKMQLIMLPGIIPSMPTKRTPVRWDIAQTAIGTTRYFPALPVMGRKRLFWAMKLVSGSANFAVTFQGITVSGMHRYEPDRLGRFPTPGGSAESSIGGDIGGYMVENLDTELLVPDARTGITPSGDFSYQYEGRFDFVRALVTITSGSIPSLSMTVTGED